MHFVGDDRILKSEKAAILNSRQTKMPTGDMPWIQNSFKAIQDALSKGCVIITSVGMNTWEYLVWATGFLGGCQIIVAPIEDKDDPEEYRKDIIEDFGLERARTGFMFFKTIRRGIRGKSAWQERDNIVISLANRIYPVAVRPEGNLEALIKANPAKFSDAIVNFSVNRQTDSGSEKVTIEKSELTSRLKSPRWNYLTHYTRATYAPWPGESSADYYRAIFNSRDKYPRSALETLKRIVEVKKLWASYYHIRGGHKVVSFTELAPVQAISFIKWRAQYVRWNFEPYGLAIEKDFALRIGIRPVIYGSPEEYFQLDEKDRPFYQNPGDKGGDWEPETEWRGAGHVDLSRIPTEKIILLVRNRSDLFDSIYRIIPLTE